MRAELFKIMRFWLDLGADGFRVDMAHSLVKADPDLKETMTLWGEVRAMFDADYPEAVLMSEWSDPAKAILGGFHVDFMLAFGNPPAYIALLRKEKGRNLDSCAKHGHSFFDKAGKGDIGEFLDTYLKHFLQVKDKGYITIPSGNHDCTRLGMGRSSEEIATVFAMIMTMPGIPFIYNGDEIGMRHVEGLVSKEGGYSRTGARTPMQWDQTADAGFSTAAAAELYLPIDPDPDRPNVCDQETNPESLLNIIRRLGQLRKRHSALSGDGDFIPLFAEPGKYPFVYQRENASGAFIIAINPSAQTVRASFCSNDRTSPLQQIEGCEVSIQIKNGKCELEMPGISYAVFKCPSSDYKSQELL
ncbi:MAG: alpha-amylase family glycosyl hydrolase [Chthoniobacteraceae bacterium]